MNAKQQQRKALLDKWGGVIDESFGKLPENKKYFLAALAHNVQYINEGFDNVYSQNLNGMGPVAFPADPGTQQQFHDPSRKVGSIDVPANTLALNMNLAAQTILFDLLPTVPVYSPLVQLDYVDYVYGGGKLGSGEGPRYFLIKWEELYNADSQAGIKTLRKGDVIYVGKKEVDALCVKATFVQTSRVAGYVIVRNDGVYKVAETETKMSFIASNEPLVAAAQNADTIFKVDVDGTATDIVTGMTKVIFDLVSAGDEQIHGFVTLNEDGDPMSRAQSEFGNSKVMELRTFSKAIEVKTYQVWGALTRRQVKDLKARGLDSVAIIKNAMQNEITQAINDNGLSRMRRLGVTTHANLLAAQGYNLNLYIGAAGSTGKDFKAFSIPEFIDAAGVDRAGEMGIIQNAESNSSAENQITRQARIATRILAASAIIGNLSRFGAGDAAVVNTITLVALKTQKNFVSAIDNTLVQDNKNLYYAGDLAGIKIYCDPKQMLNDNRVLVLRTNKTADGVDIDNINQGMVFLPYDLASTVEITAEGTAAPKLLIESDYALAETGMYPSLSYLTFAIDSDYGWI
jgi:hypothetical protein